MLDKYHKGVKNGKCCSIAFAWCGGNLSKPNLVMCFQKMWRFRFVLLSHAYLQLKLVLHVIINL